MNYQTEYFELQNYLIKRSKIKGKLQKELVQAYFSILVTIIEGSRGKKQRQQLKAVLQDLGELC